MFLPKPWAALILLAAYFAPTALACEQVLSSDYRLSAMQTATQYDDPHDRITLRSGLSDAQAVVVRAAAKMIQIELEVSSLHFRETGVMLKEGIHHAGTELAQAIEHYERITGFIFPAGLTQLFVYDLIQRGEPLPRSVAQLSPEPLRKSVLEAFDHARFYGVVSEHDSSSSWASDLLKYAAAVVHHPEDAVWVPITRRNLPVIPREAIPVYIWNFLTPEQQKELRAPRPIRASGFEYLDAKVILSPGLQTFTRLGPYPELGGVVWRDDETGAIWTNAFFADSIR